MENTGVIKLRKFSIKDLDRIMEIFPDKSVTDPIGLTIAKNPPKVTRQFEEGWLKKTISNYSIRKPEEYSLAITLDDALVGSAGLKKIDYQNESLEIGYWIGRDYWGKGYATSALNLLLAFADKRFHPKRITGLAFTFNPASKRVMEKCGFELECIRRNIKKGKDKFYDEYAMVRFR